VRSEDQHIKSGPLAVQLRDRIEREGPISFRDWMQAALYDENHGYYCRTGPIRQGRAGDYRTAPETSPLFAATFASYFSKLFAELSPELDSPLTWTIFESGAGGGAFAHHVLKTLRDRYPEVFAVTKYVIDEISQSASRRLQAQLSEFADRVTFQRLAEINNPVKAGICFSNELIDAFPVHRVIGREGKLRELCVGISDGEFGWVESDPDRRVAEYCARIELQLAEDQIAELNLDAENYFARAAGLFDRGFVITVDYGAERSELLESPDRFAGTLRAFRRHQMIQDVLADPGEQDLTTTVDWTQIKAAGRRSGLRPIRFERLDQFLLAEGLTDVLSEMLGQTRDQVEALRLTTGAREMIMPHGLSASFQILVQEKAPAASLLGNQMNLPPVNGDKG
jgi:SAM-dependent MidA family methyltransferase